MTPQQKTNRHITLLASLGSTLEYFDFVIYAMMATYLSVIFFPSQDAAVGVLLVFLVSAVGYFARPLGGVLIGLIGDWLGRKPAFLLSTGLMAFSTFFIACLPTYETFGIIAAILLVILRFSQGLSFGGELPGAMTIVAEFSPLKTHGRKASLVIASTSLGALLANGALYGLSAMMSKEEIIAWGWRIPFLIGGILGILLLFARNTIQETPVFQSLQNKNLLSHHKMTIIKVMFMMVLMVGLSIARFYLQITTNKSFFSILIFSAFLYIIKLLYNLLADHKIATVKAVSMTAFMAGLIMTNLFLPYFIPKYFSYSESSVFLGSTISLILLVLIFPTLGRIVDELPNKARTLRWICGSYFILSVPIFSLLTIGNSFGLFAFLIIQQIYIGFFSSAYFPVLISIFSPRVRYTGIALSYNLSWALMATLPMGYTALLEEFGSPWVVPIVLSTIGAVCFMATRGLKEKAVDSSDPENEKSINYEMAS